MLLVRMFHLKNIGLPIKLDSNVKIKSVIRRRHLISMNSSHKDVHYTNSNRKHLHRQVLLVPEEDDISLKERCRRVNAWCLLHGKQNAILVSIHVNAYGNGSEWTKPHGWSIYTSKGKTAADALATCIFDAAKQAIVDLHVEGITEYLAVQQQP